jgi:hypothetical protein
MKMLGESVTLGLHQLVRDQVGNQIDDQISRFGASNRVYFGTSVPATIPVLTMSRHSMMRKVKKLNEGTKGTTIK